MLEIDRCDEIDSGDEGRNVRAQGAQGRPSEGLRLLPRLPRGVDRPLAAADARCQRLHLAVLGPSYPYQVMARPPAGAIVNLRGRSTFPPASCGSARPSIDPQEESVRKLLV